MRYLREEDGTYHNLAMLRKTELQRLLECLDDDTHSLRRQGEPKCGWCAHEQPRDAQIVHGDSQGLVLAEVVRHLPVIVTDRWCRAEGTGEDVWKRTSW